MVFNWKPENPSCAPNRLAGTIKQYSKKAIPQLMRITFQRAVSWCFKCPYQAKVIKVFEINSKIMVRIQIGSLGDKDRGRWWKKKKWQQKREAVLGLPASNQMGFHVDDFVLLVAITFL